jgi:Protein of unknown function (DUF1580)
MPHNPSVGLQGPYISLARACQDLPGYRGKARLHPATLTRWILRGIRGADGTRVRLTAVRCGGRWLTSTAAMAEFQAALTAASLPPADLGGPIRSPSARSRVSADAEARLIAAGA